MSAATYYIPEVSEDTIFLQTLRSQPGVSVLLDGRVPTATLVSNGREYAITYHAVERFVERSEGKNSRQQKSLKRIQRMFPHLDLQSPDQALVILVSLIKQATRGIIVNGKKKQGALLSEGWIFPFREDGGVTTVVTCYPKDPSVRFYG